MKKEILRKHMNRANGDLTVRQEEWILKAMEEYAAYHVLKFANNLNNDSIHSKTAETIKNGTFKNNEIESK